MFVARSISAQSISPLQTSEVCPSQNITFSVSIPGQHVTSVTGVPLNASPTVIQQPFNVTIASGTIMFDFVGKFADYNNKQTYRVNYTNSSGQTVTWDFTYLKIKSFQSVTTCSQIHPNILSINASPCQTANFPISFSNVQFGNPYEAPEICYTTITTYEYLPPSGWKLNGTASNGTSWLSGTNSATITSDLSNGDGGSARVRLLEFSQ